jgi:hypothetical protein
MRTSSIIYKKKLDRNGSTIGMKEGMGQLLLTAIKKVWRVE